MILSFWESKVKGCYDIFKNYSEDYFRKLEYDTIKMVCSAGNNKIISIGGGAFENPDSRVTLLNFGQVFLFKIKLRCLILQNIKRFYKTFIKFRKPF